MPELYNGRVLFRKRDNKTVWLRFTTTKNWIVSSAADKEANNDVGYAFAPGSDSALPSVSGWRIHDAGGFVADEGISVTLSDALKIAVSVAVLILVTVTLLVVCWMFAARCCSIARCCITRSYGCVACVLTCHPSAFASRHSMCADLSSKRIRFEDVDTRLRVHFLIYLSRMLAHFSCRTVVLSFLRVLPRAVPPTAPSCMERMI